MYEWQCWNVKEQDYNSYWNPKSQNAGMCLGGDITCVTTVVQKFSNANCVCVCVCVCVYTYNARMDVCVCVCVLIFLFYYVLKYCLK